MYELVVPNQSARAGIECQQAISVQIRTLAVGAIEIVGRGAGGHINNTPLAIERHRAPVVGTTDVFPRIRRPGRITWIPRTRYGVETPCLTPGEHIVGADVAGGRTVLLTCGRAHNDQVLEDPARRERLDEIDAVRITAETLAQVNTPLIAECLDLTSSARVELSDAVIRVVDYPAITAVVAAPVVKSATDD